LDATEPTVLMCDNQNAIKLFENLIFHDRTKHIVIRHHFIREKVNEKEIEVNHVASSDQLVDIFTKPLART
jgi:predicted metallo-beta-lactamase superfamily hydrolase